MDKLKRTSKLIVFDTLGGLVILGALLTGWVPGPGGIPLLIVGLSLLAINHDWAKRYIELLKKYTNRVGDLIFATNPKIQMLYDCIAPLLFAGGVAFLVRHTAAWMVSAGIVLVFAALTLFLGNRQRYQRLKKKIKK